MSSSHRRARIAVAALTLFAAPLAVTVVGEASSAEPVASAITSTSEATAAFRRPADVLRARRAAHPPVRLAKPAPAQPGAGQAATGVASAGFRFGALVDGRPVRWNPCHPIRWTANASRGPAGGLTVLQQAVTRIAGVTQTTWQYVGPSTAVPTSAYLPKQARTAYPPVLLGWTDGRSSDLLAGQAGHVLGMARTSWFGVQSADGRRTAATRAGVVALDRTDRLPLRGPHSWYTVALHELGHVMGLDHVEDRRQLMSGTLPPATDLQAGDRAGLAALGRRAGCVVVP